MTKHYLLNGDEIKVGEVYRDRNGTKAFVAAYNYNRFYVSYEKEIYLTQIDKNGFKYGVESGLHSYCDLISLWKEEPVTKCDQLIESNIKELEALELTIKEIELASKRLFDTSTCPDCNNLLRHCACSMEEPKKQTLLEYAEIKLREYKIKVDAESVGYNRAFNDIMTILEQK